jgi:hypothetical protein
MHTLSGKSPTLSGLNLSEKGSLRGHPEVRARSFVRLPAGKSNTVTLFLRAAGIPSR